MTVRPRIFLALLFALALTPLASFAQAAPPLISPEHQSTLMTLFIQSVAPVLFSGLALLLAAVFAQLARKFGAQAKATKTDQVLARVLVFAQSVVHELEVTLKPQLAAACMDGVLTKHEIATLRKVALERLKQLAGEKGLSELQAILGIAAPQLETFLQGIIEKVVAGMPPSTPPLAVRAAGPLVPGALVPSP